MEFPPVMNMVTATVAQLSSAEKNPTNAAQAPQPVANGSQSSADGGNSNGSQTDSQSGKNLEAKA